APRPGRGSSRRLAATAHRWAYFLWRGGVMSETLRVTLDGHQLAPSEEADLQDLYRTAAKAVISPSMASSIRLVLRREPHGTTIEPFLGSASLEALLRIAKKRSEAIALLGALVSCAFLFCEHVGVLLLGARPKLLPDQTGLNGVVPLRTRL